MFWKKKEEPEVVYEYHYTVYWDKNGQNTLEYMKKLLQDGWVPIRETCLGNDMGMLAALLVLRRVKTTGNES